MKTKVVLVFLAMVLVMSLVAFGACAASAKRTMTPEEGRTLPEKVKVPSEEEKAPAEKATVPGADEPAKIVEIGKGETASTSPSLTSKPTQPVICEVSENLPYYKYVINFVSNPEPTIHHYNIYKEIEVDVYEIIGEVAASSESSNYSYVDYSSNPSQRSARYKISAVNDEGQESKLSNYHQPVFLQVNQGAPSGQINLDWTSYLGRTLSQYEIYRDSDLGDAHLHLYDTISGSLTSYTDTNLTSPYYYFVKPLFSSDCCK